MDSWRDGPTKSAIVDFVDRVTTAGTDFVEPEARIAVFDNDGTLWVEKPAYVQLDFLVRRLAEQAAADASLAERQPFAAAAAGDLAWFGDAVTKHYDGDDSGHALEHRLQAPEAPAAEHCEFSFVFHRFVFPGRDDSRADAHRQHQPQDRCSHVTGQTEATFGLTARRSAPSAFISGIREDSSSAFPANFAGRRG